MPQELHGQMLGAGKCIALVVSRFNDLITSRLLGGAVEMLLRCGVGENDITTVHVPGAFDIPLIAKKLAESGRYHAIVCLGCVIRGQTPHFEYISTEVAKGVGQVSFQTGIPATFGVITADTLEQALERAGAKSGNKGAEAAACAVELADLLDRLPKRANAT